MNRNDYLFKPLEKLSSIMGNTKEVIEYIVEKKSEFKIRSIPSLDEVFVEFLKKYEIFIQPITSNKNNIGQAILGGALTGMSGIDAGGDIFMISGQEKQTKGQECSNWKQWTLDQKDLEFFRVEKIDIVKQQQKIIEKLGIQEQLKYPATKKVFYPVFEKWRREEDKSKKKDEEFNKILKTNGMPLAIILSLAVGYLVATYQEEDSSSENPIILTSRADLSAAFGRFYEFFLFSLLEYLLIKTIFKLIPMTKTKFKNI